MEMMEYLVEIFKYRGMRYIVVERALEGARTERLRLVVNGCWRAVLVLL